MLSCGLNSEGPLKKTKELFLQIDHMNLNKADNLQLILDHALQDLEPK